jgi:hypothetical protein
MWGVLTELFAVAAIIVAIAALAWFSEPIENQLLTGRTCAEITERLAAQKDHVLTPAEHTDVANCSEP